MMRSLFAAVSGLKCHQQRMDVIGNNIANVNTPGYKRGRVNFQDMLNQTIRGASRPVPDGRGGTNPMQIGPGVSIGSIDLIMGGSSLQDTGKNTDLGVDGDGFFILSDGSRNYYSRVGCFDFDGEGNMISLLHGLRVMGWMPDAEDPNRLSDILTDIKINLNESEEAKATENMSCGGNLDSRVKTGESESTIVLRHMVYDSKGQEYTVPIELKKTDDNKWTWTLADNSIIGPRGDKLTGTATGEITFDTIGKYSTVDNNSITFTPPGSDQLTINLDFSKLTQYGSPFSADIESQDGYKSGTLESFAIDQSGSIEGVFSNGVSRRLGQIALSRFTNPAGLFKEGNSLYSVTSNSGAPNVNIAGSSGFGTVKPGSLEMSNVDLSSEFTDMIITQRGFQANSRVITTSDEMLQELVNLKR
ncbi:MAG TPA: flagellar hook protein FlgE [Syntrophomonadaceae bacterium]|nr:flagellar hook protein FlgE [Syntrophomonadaceae bacterium]